MPLQSSGAISISQIKAELGSASNSLRALSSEAGKSTPDSMSEFYGYSAVTWFSVDISESGFEDPGIACAEGQFFGVVTVYHDQNGFNNIRTSPGGELFDGRNLWYYVPNFAGSFFIDSRGGVGDFADCKK